MNSTGEETTVPFSLSPLNPEPTRGTGPEPPSSAVPRVLMVEDDAEFASDMVAVFSGAAEITIVPDTRACAEALTRERPDLLWLDLDLPPCFAESGAQEGLVFLDAIRAAHPDLAVILVSGRITLPVLEECRRLRVLAVIAKPPDLGRLRSVFSGL